MRRLQNIDNDLERAVFLANYNAPRQRLLRFLAAALISLKHGVRGLLYVWPLTLLMFIELPPNWNWLRIVLMLLAVVAWFRFIYGSVRDDYARFVQGYLLEAGQLRRVL